MIYRTTILKMHLFIYFMFLFNSFIRKGKVGACREEFTGELNDKFRDYMAKSVVYEDYQGLNY